MRQLSHVFALHKQTLSPCIARLSVLYEDLRIEVEGISAVSIPALDVTSQTYRAQYFLRRAIASLVEFADALRLLDGKSEFSQIKSGFNPQLVRYWNRSVSFFDRHEQHLKLIRNDVGGHFGQRAAEYAVDNVDSSSIGKIEARNETTMHLDFAGDLAAAAIFRHLSGSTADRKFVKLLRMVLVAFRHAARAVHCLAFTYLWARFG
jgi:hypothetical protein